MGQYIVKRLAFSLLIILGVIAVTFLLFRVAAGDPAAAVLGKNPQPEEIERLRQELGSDKPMFWGRWRRTEAFSSLEDGAIRALPGVTIPAEAIPADGKILRLKNGEKVEFQRNFTLTGPVRCEFVSRGAFVCKDATGRDLDWTRHAVTVDGSRLELAAGDELAIREVKFYLPQVHPWDSQFTAALREVVSFTSHFPYVDFFDFGRSLTTREPVRDIMLRGIVPSLLLMLPVFFGEMLIGIVLALFSAAWKDSLLDRSIVILSVAGMSISYLVFIIFGQWYLGYYYHVFPIWGYGSLEYLLLPILIGIVSSLGGGVRFYRTVFVNELNKEYLRTARAKGCSIWKIFGKHLLRNAAVPILTRAATILPFLFTGSLLLETFFGIPGLGYAGINALNNSDLQMIKALVIIGALIFVLINLLTDIAYAWVDPRVRLK